MRALLLFALLLPACGNPCQQVCSRMATYARECGYTVSARDVAACVDEQAGPLDREDREVCREEGTRQGLRSTFTCEDLDAYFARTVPPDADEAADPDTAW